MVIVVLKYFISMGKLPSCDVVMGGILTPAQNHLRDSCMQGESAGGGFIESCVCVH